MSNQCQAMSGSLRQATAAQPTTAFSSVSAAGTARGLSAKSALFVWRQSKSFGKNLEVKSLVSVPVDRDIICYTICRLESVFIS